MEIRPATSADVREIAEVHVASWNDAYRGIVPDDSIAERDVDRRTEQWNELVGTQIVLVADQQGAIAGFAAADRSTGTIGAIYIAPEHVRAGIGTQLLDAAHQQLRAAGRTHANLWVFSANATARAFYAARGYEPDGTADVIHGQLTLRLSTAL